MNGVKPNNACMVRFNHKVVMVALKAQSLREIEPMVQSCNYHKVCDFVLKLQSLQFSEVCRDRNVVTGG